MIITKKWIMDNQTPGGSWNAKQLKVLGISWPAPKGWIGRLVGTKITTSNKGAFEHLAGDTAKDKINVQDHERRIDELELSVKSLTSALNILVMREVKRDHTVALELIDHLIMESN